VKKKIFALIFAALLILGFVLFLKGVRQKESGLMIWGVLLMILYGVTPTVKFMFGFIFDLIAKEGNGSKGFFWALLIDVIVLIVIGPTGLALLLCPIFALIEIIKTVLGKGESTEDGYSLRKFTFAAIFGIVLGCTIGVISNIFVGLIEERYVSLILFQRDYGYIYNFMSTLPFLCLLIFVILSIRIGYKWGLFGFGSGKKGENDKIIINGNTYYKK
jgi:hypothetical protein